MSFVFNHIADDDNGSHPFSPFFRGLSEEVLQKCTFCETYVSEIELTITGHPNEVACEDCLKEIKNYEHENFDPS
jgi:hypothetical protein